MGPTRVLSAPGGPHVGPMNLAIREDKAAAAMWQSGMTQSIKALGDGATQDNNTASVIYALTVNPIYYVYEDLVLCVVAMLSAGASSDSWDLFIHIRQSRFIGTRIIAWLH